MVLDNIIYSSLSYHISMKNDNPHRRPLQLVAREAGSSTCSLRLSKEFATSRCTIQFERSVTQLNR